MKSVASQQIISPLQPMNKYNLTDNAANMMNLPGLRNNSVQ